MLLVGILLVAFNLRAAIAAVSPVLPEIRADLDLSASAAGLLTAIPVLCFAVLAPAAAWFGRRLGLENAILIGCLAIAIGTVWRVLGGPVTLLTVTVLIGAAMTIGNVLVPVVIKRDFGVRAGSVTGLFTASLIAGAAAAAALTAPVSVVTHWRVGLAIWAVLAVVAAVVWWAATRRRARHDEVHLNSGRISSAGIWRSAVAWGVAIFMGAQAASYFAMTAWLPTLLVDDAGIDLEAAGIGMSVFQVMGIAGTLLVSVAVRLRPRQGWIARCVAAGWAVMLVGLVAWPAGWPLWTVVGGVAQGAGIALALTLVVMRAHDAVVARGLSAMTQLVGYLVGAAGPVVVGVLYERTGSWVAPMVLLVALAGCMAVTGAVAGRPATVGRVTSSQRD